MCEGMWLKWVKSSEVGLAGWSKRDHASDTWRGTARVRLSRRP